ncbi:MAG: BamA/TamA family outer membrane protein [Elusimicrobia bacterium]|nr:BamA/TamA family outer membrane protein [Elusimicrobiota bacterium]
MLKKLSVALPALILPVLGWSQEGGPQDLLPKREMIQQVEPPSPETPKALRWMLKPIKKGILVRLPIVDTDPNRGVTAGVMPIWVIQDEKQDLIKHIHAPSLTYNRNFGFIPTYRYYYYPASNAALILRGSASGQAEREFLGHYDDGSFAGTPVDLELMLQYNVDAGKRFFGLGPASPKSAESNYIEDIIQYKVGAGLPLAPESHWRIRLADHLQAFRLSNGPIANLPSFSATFPGVAPIHRQQSHDMRLAVNYDTRDHAVTTSRGAYLETFFESSTRDLASSYDYTRWSVDARYFRPWPNREGKVLGINLKYEQLLGNAPFWLLPSLGGKYNQRAYGAGRYVDRGMMALNLEQRFTFWSARMAGVKTEFELAPFTGLGSVFDNPGKMTRRHMRPVYGAAVRAVAKPQVVGSIDFGLGQEGLAVFMDINYSF